LLIDGRTVPDGSVLTTDLCVVGAGAAGITIAHRLAGSRHDVVVVESGGFEPDGATQSLAEGAVVGLPLDPANPTPLESARLRYFGGTTNHWAGNCRPLDEAAFDSRPYLSQSGWPFSRDALWPYYVQAVDVLALLEPRFEWQYWTDQGFLDPPPFAAGSFVPTVRQVPAEPRLGIRYRQELTDSPNVRVALWSNVVEIAGTRGSNAVETVRIVTLRGNAFTVQARAYVLATGGIEVPRLLLASRAINPAGLGNGHGLVGRNFAEHPSVLGGVIVLDGASPFASSEQERRVDDGSVRKVRVSPWLTLDRRTMIANELAAVEITVPDFLQQFSAAQVTKAYSRVAQVGTLRRAQGSDRPNPQIMVVNFEQEPNLASRVLLSSEVDALGIPKARLDWRLTRDDRYRAIRALQLLGATVGRLGIGRVLINVSSDLSAPGKTDIDPDKLDFAVAGNFHHMGTARMHSTPRKGVVDPDCKLHEATNLYLAGSAVFPATGAAPPTMTIVALALRLADHLSQKVLPPAS
jgi:choline dehydrogenase-like flavoprotein